LSGVFLPVEITGCFFSAAFLDYTFQVVSKDLRSVYQSFSYLPCLVLQRWKKGKNEAKELVKMAVATPKTDSSFNPPI
jgi:hypothetical protein